jgi:GDP-L-fucose synthase
VSGAPRPEFWSGRTVAVTGGAGFLGKPTVRMLGELGARARVVRSAQHDLRDRAACLAALEGAEIVIHLAANVGGIGYNRRNPAPLVHDNLAMGINVFEACRELELGKLVAACSVCAYPLETPVPFSEDEIWNGYPERSNASYGLAKRMLLVLSETYRNQYGLDSCVPVIANLYGPGDNFDLEDSHVIAAMIRKYVEAIERGEERVALWGTGSPTREFLYVDDAARALLLAAEHCETSEPFNVGSGAETRIRDLAETISALTGFEGDTVWDASRPDGQPRRYLDVTRARELLGFEAEVTLPEGLRRAIESFRSARPAGAAA